MCTTIKQSERCLEEQARFVCPFNSLLARNSAFIETFIKRLLACDITDVYSARADSLGLEKIRSLGLYAMG